LTLDFNFQFNFKFQIQIWAYSSILTFDSSDMARLLTILILLSLVSHSFISAMPDQITDDEDDLAMDMPQNGPDEGSGEPDDDDSGKDKAPSAASIPPITAVPAPPKPTQAEVTEKDDDQQITVEPTLDIVFPTEKAKDEKPHATSTAPPTSAGLSTGALVGIIVAVVIAIILIIIIIVCVVKRSKGKPRNSQRRQQEQTTRGREQVPQHV